MPFSKTDMGGIITTQSLIVDAIDGKEFNTILAALDAVRVIVQKQMQDKKLAEREAALNAPKE